MAGDLQSWSAWAFQSLPTSRSGEDLCEQYFATYKRMWANRCSNKSSEATDEEIWSCNLGPECNHGLIYVAVLSSKCISVREIWLLTEIFFPVAWETCREETHKIFSSFCDKSHMKMEQAVWNKIASYNFFAFAGLKPQFATGYWAVYLRDMPILNSFGSPFIPFSAWNSRAKTTVVHRLESSLPNKYCSILVGLLPLPSI